MNAHFLTGISARMNAQNADDADRKANSRSLLLVVILTLLMVALATIGVNALAASRSAPQAAANPPASSFQLPASAAPAATTRYVASPNRGLAGYWKLDEGNGTTAADASGAGRTGTLLGGPTWSAAAPPAIHYPDPYALSFDGADRTVTVPHEAGLNPATFTVAAWIRASAWTAESWRGVIVGKDSATGYAGYALRAGESGRLSFAVGNGSAWQEALSGQVMTVNTWHHVAGVYDGSALSLYVDGVEQGSAAFSGAFAPSSNPLNIGRSPAYTDRRFQGTIDDVRVYSRAVTQPELMALSGGNLASGLLLYWKFDDGSSTTTADASGAGRTGTFGGSPTWTAGKPASVTYYDPYSLDFNGTSDFVSRHDAALELNASSFTLAAWIRADAWKTDRYEGTILSKESTSEERGYVLRTGDNGRLSFSIGDGDGWPEAYSGQVMATGVWYHVAGTLDDSTHTLRIYINGVEQGSATAGDGLYASGNALRVAASEWDNRYFDGRIDDVRVYNRVLTAAEITALAGTVNDCMSQAAPCVSLQSAAETAAAGDTIVAQPGRYLERIFINKEVTLRNSGSGVDLLLDGFSAGPVVTVQSGGAATLQYLTLQGGGNAASAGGGAAVLAGGQLALEQAVVAANTAQYGGGVYSAGTLAIRDALILQNSASEGGGVAVAGGTTTIRNSTLISNTAAATGGALATRSADSTVKVSFSTLTGNRAQTAGGIYRYSTSAISLRAALITYNTLSGGGTAGTEDCGGTLTSAGYNLVRTAAFGAGACAIAAAQTGDAVGGEYPLGVLKDNGGLTFTVAPLSGNAAIERVPAAACSDLDTAAVSADQRGIARPQDSDGNGTAACETGAFERRPTPLLTVTTTTDEYGALDDICGLREAIQTVNNQATFGGCGYTAGAYAITLPAGTYALSRSGAGEDVNATGDLDILRRLKLTGAGAGTTTIRAGGLDRALHSLSSDPVEIGGVTLTGGAVTGPGGGIYVQTGSLTMRTAVVEGNTATTSGGGVAASATLTVITTTVSNNAAANGGGLAGLAGSSLAVADSALSDNTATTAGGGLYAGGTAIAKNSTVNGNTANAGGGVSVAAGGQADLRFITLAENRTLVNAGAHLQNGGALSLTAAVVTLPLGGSSCAGSALGTGGYNRLSDGSCSFTSSSGTDAANATIELLPASLNGGATITYLPRATASNAILDIMPQAACEQALGWLADQRGEPRPRAIIGNAYCDAGAVELSRQVRTVCGPPLSRDLADPRCNFLSIGLALTEARDGDTIIVAGVVTETVTVNHNVTIRGPLASESTPGTHMGIVQAAATQGVAAGPIFTIPAGRRVTLQGLNIRHAAVSAGGAIANAGSLTLDGVTLYAHNLSGTGSVIHNSGDLRVINSTLTDNQGSYAAPTDGLAGHWKFDEGSGTAAADASGNGNAGTLVNGPGWTSATPALGWSNPYAVILDGTDDYVTVPNHAALTPERLTVAAWIKADAWTTEYYQGVIVGKDDDSAPSGHGYTLRTGAGGKLSFAVVSASGECHALSAALMSTGVWTHVAGVYDGSTVKAYINGVERGSGACTAALTHSTNAFVVGRSARYADRIFGGAIDDVRVYSRALSAAELAGLALSASASGVGDTVLLRNTANTAAAVTVQSSTLVGTGTLVRNDAALGSAAVITNSILSSAAAGAACVNTASGGDNLTHNITCFATPGTGDRDGDPALGRLRDNGGPTLTRAIAAGSPALGISPCPVAADQRGRARPAGLASTTCASGAVDLAPVTLSVCANCEIDAAVGRYADPQEAFNAAMAGDTVRIEAGAYTGNFIIYRDLTVQHAGIDVAALSRERPTDVRAILQAAAATVAEQRQLTAPGGTALLVQSYAPTGVTIGAGSDVSVTLRGLTVRYGLSTTGGGIVNLGTLAVYTSTVAENAAYNVMSSGTVVTPGRGGGIYNAGALTLERSTVSGNQAESAGGGLYNAGPAGAGAAATVSLTSCTLADNRASRLPDRKLVAVTDTGMSPATLTATSGDEIRFENRTARSRTLNIAAGAGVTCQPVQLTTPVMGAGLSAPLICTLAATSGSGTASVTDADNASLTLTLTVQAVSFTPAGHAVYRAGNSTTTIGRSIVFSSAAGPAQVCGRPGADTFAVMVSAGYNLVSDGSCFPEPKTTDLQVGQGQVARLGVLQDNNTIDFEARWVSGFTYTQAPKPASAALDRIPLNVCRAATEHNITVMTGALPTTTLDAGDTVIWSQASAGARTIALNDGEANVELIALPTWGASAARQFTAAGSYLYRVYDDTTRAEVASGLLTVLAKVRPVDQRGTALPQRGALDVSASASYACDAGAVEFQPWVVGQPLPRPPTAVGTTGPRWGVASGSADSYHTWSPGDARDYVLRPSLATAADGQPETITIYWKIDADPASLAEMTQVGFAEWPPVPQLHVSAAPVNLGHSGIRDGFLVSQARAFEGNDPQDAAAGTLLSSGVFSRTVLPALRGDSYTVLQFTRGNQASATLKALVVKTVDWNTPGVRDMRAERTACTIGSALSYPALTDSQGRTLPGHADPEGRSGWILAGEAYDGVKRQADQGIAQNTVDGLISPAFIRETRSGPIIPILEQAPTFSGRGVHDSDLVNGGHDLRIAWYRADGRQVGWPLRTVGYRCIWPATPPQIVIASELGSEIGGQATLAGDRYADLTVYHQPLAGQPGYSPNHEHALLAASNPSTALRTGPGNAAQTLYALRNDLQDRNPTAAGNQSYVLLKYHDPREGNQVKIGVYQVELTRTAPAITDYTTAAGRITVNAAAQAGANVEDKVQDKVEAKVQQEERSASTSASTSTSIRVQDASAVAGTAIHTTLEALNITGAARLRTATIRVAYDPAKLTPTACAAQSVFAERLAGLRATSDAPRRPGSVVRLRAALTAGTDALYTWDFGDGITQSTGPQVSHAYGAARVYTVTVTARNGLFSDTLTASIPVTISAEAPLGTLADLTSTGCRVEPAGTLTFELAARNKHGVSGNLTLANLTFTTTLTAGQSATVTPMVFSLAGPAYDHLADDVVAGNPVYAPTPLRNLLAIKACSETAAADVTARPFWKDFRNAVWARAAGDMEVLYFYPLQAGFHLRDADAVALGLTDSTGAALPAAERVGRCVPWLHKQATGTVVYPDFPQAGQNTRVLPVAYHAEWPALPPLLSVGETVYQRTKHGITGVATQLAVARIYDDLAPGAWIGNTIVVTGSQAVRSVAQLIDPMSAVQVPVNVKINGNFSLPEEILTAPRLAVLGGGLSLVGNTNDPNLALPFALRSRVSFSPSTGELGFGGYYDGASPEYIKGDPLLLLNVMSLADRARLQALCGRGAHDGGGSAYPFDATDCGKYKKAVEDLYHKTHNPRGLDLCRDSSGKLAADDPGPATNQQARTATMTVCRTEGATVYYRDGRADWAFLIGAQDADGGRGGHDGVPEPYAGVGKGQALTAGAAAGTGYITLAYNNDQSLGGLPVSLQVIKVGCELNAAGDDSAYRGNLLTIKSDNLFDEKLTLRHTGDFGGRPDDFTFEWWIAAVDETAVSPSAAPPAYPWSRWTKIESGASALGPEITIEGANPTTLRDNWLLMRYQGYPACGNQVVWSAFAGDPSAKPSETRAQLAEGWIKRVTTALNPYDARVDDFVSAPVNTTVDMISQAGKRYEGPIAMNNDPDNLNRMGLIEAYQTVQDRGRQLSIDSGINDQGANAALLNVTSRIADLYMLLANDAYADAADPTVGLSLRDLFGENGQVSRAPEVYAFMNQFRPDSFGLIDEELALLRGRDETLGGVAAGPTYNRLTWNFTNGEGQVAYVSNYNIKDLNRDGFVNAADAAVLYPQGHGDAWGHYLTALTQFYALLRHPDYTWSPRAEPVSVAGAPVVVDYYDERRFAADAAAKARVGAEIVDLAYRKLYAEPASQEYVDSHVDVSDGQRRAWGVADWARRAGQGAYFDWVVGNAVLPAVDERYSDVRKVDRTTVAPLAEIVAEYATIQQQLDKADGNANPLGLAPDAVVFDLNPAETQTTPTGGGLTHYEQIAGRATEILEDAMMYLDYANETKVALREEQNDRRDFVDAILDEDRGRVNELIELFGYPYDADIGVNGTYPAGYSGPDIYNYDLVDRYELTDSEKRCSARDVSAGICKPEARTYTLDYKPLACLGAYVEGLGYVDDPEDLELCAPLQDATTQVTYTIGIGVDAGYGRFKPATWPAASARPGRGEIQVMLNNLYGAKVNYEAAINSYQNYVAQVEDQQAAIADRAELLDTEGKLSNAARWTVFSLNTVALTLQEIALVQQQANKEARQLADAASNCLPTVVGLATDVTSAGRCALLFAGNAVAGIMSGMEIAASVAQDAAGLSADIAERALETDLFELESDYELRQMGRELQGLLRDEEGLRLEMYLAADAYFSAIDDYKMIVQRGFMKLRELSLLRQRWAGQVSEQRYNDMIYRMFQNDALQKYRREFDLAQTYTYLTAAAYDYETNLAGSDPANGDQFLRKIVGMRTLGQIGYRESRPIWPIAGSRGLSGPLGQMRDNFLVLKGQMGFNNPQAETNRFSLRSELFRLRDESDAKWRQTLQRYYTADIFSNDAVARLAKRSYGETRRVPGLVIPFSAIIKDGLNFFGQPLGPGDSAYDATQFATKIATLGVWFEGYDTTRLANTPRVYLLPAGDDVLRPRSTSGVLRYWRVAEQLLPVPQPLSADDLADPDWLTRLDGLKGDLYAIKPYARLRAYPYSEDLEPNELNTDTRLIGRSVWNTQWLLVIPGTTLLADPEVGIERFMEDVDDIYLYFQTYSYAGTLTAQGEAEAKAEVKAEVKAETASTSALTSAPASSNPMPQPDALFYGVALRDGAPLTSGVLTAILPRLGTVTTQIAPITGTDYNYALPVPLGYYAAGDTNYAAESARVGETVRFTVNGVPAQLKNSAGISYQAYPIGAPGSGYAVTVDVSGPGSYPIGDVNVSGKRDSADALLVLKYDVGLTPGVTTWPPGPGTIYLPLCDVAEDGRCDSSDALRILMCDVGLASCPASALATADVAAVETANPAYFTVEQAADAANGELVVRVRATSPHTPLAAASLDLRYDPAQLSVVSCAENPASRLDLATCNPTSAAGMIRYTGITAGGIVETAPLIELRLHVIAPSVLAQWAPTRWAPTEGAPSGGGPAIALAVTAAFDLDGNALRPVLSAPPASDGGPRKLYLPLLILALPAAQAEPPAGSEDGAGAPPTAAPPDAISTPEPPPTIEPEPISTAAPPAPSELEPGRPEPSPSP